MSLDPTNYVEVDEVGAYKVLAEKVTLYKEKFKRIVVVGRGGLSVAQGLAYKLDLPVVSLKKKHLGKLKETDLFVDDIMCTGETIGKIPQHTHVAVLIQRKSAKGYAHSVGKTYSGSEYIKFSWEA